MADDKRVEIRQPLGNDKWPDIVSESFNTPEGKAQIALCAKALADRIDADLAEQIYLEWKRNDA